MEQTCTLFMIKLTKVLSICNFAVRAYACMDTDVRGVELFCVTDENRLFTKSVCVVPPNVALPAEMASNVVRVA